MNGRTISRLGLALFLSMAVLAACGAPAGPSITAEDVWARPAMAVTEGSGLAGSGMGLAGTGAIFMRLVNKGQEPDRLIGGQTDAAQAVEVHETIMDGEVMKMQMLAGGLQVPARGEVLLQPGSYHVMLIGITRDLKVGDKVSVELQFEKSGPLTVEAEVREP
jgi:copper(I)-binding protein